jgi:hypothetical protein
MIPEPIIEDWARRLIASAVDADEPTSETEIATLRVYEKLRKQLRAPVGEDAFQALASRALAVAKMQSPTLSPLQIMADGSLVGVSEIDSKMGKDESGQVGIILVTQLLRLFITLLGEGPAVRLIEGAESRIQIEGNLNKAGPSIPTTAQIYLGPFENILLEADQLRNVSERLETLTVTHDGIDEMMSVAGNIRRIASALDIFTLIRNKAGASKDSVLGTVTNGYLN